MENKKELLKYMIFAGVMGIVVGGIDTVFGKGLILIGEIRNKYFWYLIPFFTNCRNSDYLALLSL